MVSWTGKRIAKLTLFRENANQSFLKIDYEHFFFAVLYAISLYYCYMTIGEQYVEALSMYEAQEINVVDDFSNLRNRAEDYLAGKIPDPLTASADEIKAAAGPSYVIPSKWSPGFWPSIALGVVFTIHVLFVLGQKWSVGFRCKVKFTEVKDAEKATHVHVVPAAHQGKEELVPLQHTDIDRALFFDFHRRKYLYNSEADCFTKVKCRGDYPVQHYAQWTGVPTEALYAQLKELYGPNRFQMASPAFMDLYWEQITSPFTVFQVFSTLLWCLDSYWQYSLFSFFMIFTFEATTVFSRMRSLGVIKNMGNEVQPVMIYRCRRWQSMTTEDLVPGDLFSLVKNSTVSDIIPCDAILVVGGAVVNESTLTGESIPQMKDGIVAGMAGVEAEQRVNMKGLHKINTLFGGTRVLQVSSVAAKTSEESEDQHDAAELAAATATAIEGTGKSGSVGDEEKKGKDQNKNKTKSNTETDTEKNGGQTEVLTLTQQYQQQVPAPPDNGCVCYCVRTGFCSSQGKLVRLIETSQTTTVRGDTRDTVLLLFLLLVFALLASGYVLYRGMQENTRSRYQLLLHCILIVTSVVPPELPMQTALAVNNSLMTLMKMQLFCTEPFRVPIAGKVDTCVFDKTGTLTTDELVAVGIVPPSTRVEDLRRAHKEAMSKVEASVQQSSVNPAKPPPQPKQRTFFGIPLPTPQAPGAPLPFALIKDTVSVAGAGMHPMGHDLQTTADAIFVLGGCHSLVLIDGKVGGDPLEAAALKAIKWELHSDAKDVVRPTPQSVANKPFNVRLPSVRGGSSSYAARTIELTHLKIVARHHFSSKLQRMSVVVRVADVDGGMILVKGSPEAIGTMCTQLPEDYHSVSRDLARRGMRVIALAWRRITSEQVAACCESRLEVEKDLIFVGFVAFMCRVRKDSADVVHQLREGGNSVAMATGDAILTGIHVAQEVGIMDPSKRGVLLLEMREEDKSLHWVDFETERDHASDSLFSATALPALEAKYDLCTSGAALTYALDTYPELAKHLHLFAVFARMRPDEKERVLSLMKDHGRVTLMCGDGANDVGALRAAHVGIALLTGFGDLNGVKETNKPSGTAAITNGETGTGTGTVATLKTGAAATAVPAPTESEMEAKLNAMVITETDQELLKLRSSEVLRRLRLIGVDPSDHPGIESRPVELVALYRRSAAEKALEHKDIIRQKRLMKMTPQERQKELAKEHQAAMLQKQEDFKVEYERLVAAGDSWAMVTALKNMWAKEQENAKEIRARNAKNATLQGSAGNIAKMMEGLEGMEDLDQPMIKIGDASVASPFTSKMPSIRGTVDIIRQGRCTLVTTIQMYQILALNCLINAYSLSALHLDGIKYGDKQLTCLGMLMSASFISVSRSMPMERLSPVKPLKSVFHPAYFLSLLGQFALHLATMSYLVYESKKYLPEDYTPDLDGVFHQNIINSVVFLVTAVQQVSVFVVNLKGPPYMGGLTQNSPLLYSLVTTFIGVFLCASETVPQVNKWLQLEPFPSSGFRDTVLFLLLLDVVGAFLWDRFLLGVFAYPVLEASMKATTKAELIGIAKVVLLVGAVMLYFVNQDYTEIWEEYERQLNETLAQEAAAAELLANPVRTGILQEF